MVELTGQTFVGFEIVAKSGGGVVLTFALEAR